MSSTGFHILKLLHDSLIINATNYIFFNIHNQTIIHPLISHSIAQFILYIFDCYKLHLFQYTHPINYKLIWNINKIINYCYVVVSLICLSFINYNLLYCVAPCADVHVTLKESLMCTLHWCAHYTKRGIDVHIIYTSHV